MRKQWLAKSYKLGVVLFAASLFLTINRPAAYASSGDTGYEEDGSYTETATNNDLNDFFYSGAEKISDDPYHFDYASIPYGVEYRVGDFYCNGTVLYAYLGKEKNVIIPEGITQIGRDDVLLSSAFGGKPVVSVTFPSTLKVVEHSTFDGCEDLKTVTMNSGLERIGEFCFHNCNSLETITIPESVKLVESFAFSESAKLKKVDVKGKDIRFDLDVFSDTPFLKSLMNKDKVAVYKNYLLDAKGYKKAKFVVPDQVTSIAGGIFFLNESVKEIIMHDKVTILGSEVFRNCENLEKIRMSKSLTNIPYWAFVSCDNLLEITIPASVTTLESGAFFDTFIEKVNFLSKTTNFEDDVFEDTAWMSVMQHRSPFVIINGVLLDATKASGKVVIPNTVKIINDSAFAGNEEVTDIVVPDSVVRIDEHAFWSCPNLKSIDLGNSVKEIGFGAFKNCYALTSVIFPDSVEKLGRNLFTDSPAVKYIRLPAHLTRLEENALAETAITSIVIPSSVTYIARHAISPCENVKKFYLSSVLDDASYITGGVSSNGLTLYYPQDEKYNWLTEYVSEIGTRISEPSYSLNFDTLTLYPTWYGKQLQLEDEFQRYVASSDIIWKSSNSNVATVTNGMVLPVSAGTTTISADYGNKTYTCTVTVKEPFLNKSKVTLEEYDDIFLSLLYTKTSDVKWTTSNKSIVSVSQKGMLEGNKNGTATITATADGKKYSCKVTVTGY